MRYPAAMRRAAVLSIGVPAALLWMAALSRSEIAAVTPADDPHPSHDHAGSQTQPSGGGRAHDPNHHGDDNDDATMSHRFGDVKEWVARFDDPARAAWQKPEDVVRSLGLAPGQSVADIGAGTGYFNRFLSEAVGANGRVYAADIEPAMVDHMKERAATEKTPNVVPVLALPDDPKLPEAGVDVILICDTYHHIDNRLVYFDRLKRALHPGGRLAVVDFKPGDLPVGPPPEHKLAPDFVIGELQKIGWRVAAQPGFLPYQYFLIFTKN
jgi:SAM-dependent methyltransferase